MVCYLSPFSSKTWLILVQDCPVQPLGRKKVRPRPIIPLRQQLVPHDVAGGFAHLAIRHPLTQVSLSHPVLPAPERTVIGEVDL